MQPALDISNAASSSAKTSAKLHPSQFHDAAVRRNVWSIVPAFNTEYEALFKAAYWGNVARRLRPGDLIEVTAEDGAYFAVLYVMAVAEQAVSVAEVSKVLLQSVELPDDAGQFTVKWGGPVLLWTVVRAKDGVRVSDRLATKEAANTALTSYLKTLSR